MAKSLFHKEARQIPAPTPADLIGPEVAHLQKRASTRHGAAKKRAVYPWLIVLAFCVLATLYAVDPFIHAWYKGEAVRTYLYLHNYGAGPAAAQLVATQIFSRDEVQTLNHRNGSFQDYYRSPEAANRQAQAIVHYTQRVNLLRAGAYEQFGLLNQIRYFLFIRTGLGLPTDWPVLDPSVGS
jgi:hypothetical protein